MSLKQRLLTLLTSALHELNIDGVPVTVDYPADPKFGDYATNVALVAAKKAGKNPMELASEIAEKIKSLEILEKAETAPPGFINFWISKEALLTELSKPESQPNPENKKKIMVEFTDPNPFKEFHIGHLYSNIVGEAISRLLESQGAEVWRVCYQGDVGLHVAKAVWGMQHLQNEMPDDIAPLEDRASFMGKSYAIGAKAFEENQLAKEEIITLNKKIYAKDKSIMELYQRGKQWSLDYFEQIYQRLGASFKRFYFESEVGEYGAQYVKENIGKVFEESEGAVVFPGEKYGLHTRVFINSQGLPTYEAKELGLAPTKYKDYQYDQSIIITGNEINAYFKVLLKALSLLNPDLSAKTKHISHGMVRLPSGKMSSRTGDVITGEWLLDEAYKKAWMKIQEVTKTKIEGDNAYYAEEANVIPSKQMPTAEIVGTGAVKYAFLKSNIGGDIIFNFDESISFEGNAGPYLQYTFVRTKSIEREFEKRYPNESSDWKFESDDVKLENEERDVIRLLAQLPDQVTEAAERFSPNILCTYLFNLAQAFNLFYQKHPILKGEDEVRNFRLALTKAAGETIKQGLYLLGIQAPERM